MDGKIKIEIKTQKRIKTITENAFNYMNSRASANSDHMDDIKPLIDLIQKQKSKSKIITSGRES